MFSFLFDINSELLQILLALVVVGGLTVISLLKLYNYLTCGYCRNTNSMEGKTVIVTGASGGIGKVTATELAKRKARVILACRNVDSANKVRDEIVQATGNQNIVVKKLDLASQKSIREFAADVLKTEPRLDVLLHNAGTGETKTKVTEDGLELTMATNHFGPFLLTHLLIDLLKRSAPSRIVVVSSELYRLASLNLNKINPTDTYFPGYIYYVSKYANICFTKELARRLENSNVTANCLHPGIADSGIWRNVPAPFSWLLQVVIKSFFKTVEQAAQTSIYLATSEEVETVTGKYFMDCKEKDVSSGASDDAKAKKLWELSENLAGLKESDPKI